MVEGVAKELWEEIDKIIAPPGKGETRTKQYLDVLKKALEYNVTIIDDPYHAMKGITLYELLLVDKRVRGVSTSKVKDLWKLIFGDLPRSFSEYQVQLLSLLAYLYYNATHEDQRAWTLKPKAIFDVIAKLTEFESMWHFALERVYLAPLYKAMKLYDLEQIERKERTYLYAELTKIHDLLATCNLITTLAPTLHRIYLFLGILNVERARLRPGAAYYLMATNAAYYLMNRFRDLASLKPRDIYWELSPLVKYYSTLREIALDKIRQSREVSKLAGVSIVDVSSYEQLLPPAVIESVDESLRSFILRHEVASMILWLARTQGLKIDLDAYVKGVLKVIE